MARQTYTMTFLEAARTILEEMKQPMHFKKITELALQKKYLKSKGKTPEWTMGARLSVDVKEKGRQSEFIRTDNGKYGLRKWRQTVKPSVIPSTDLGVGAGRRYWLVAIEPKNFDADVAAGALDTLGVKFRMRRTLARLSPRDRVVIYLKRKAEFSAMLEVDGESYIDETERWPVDGADLSARIAVKPMTVLDAAKRIDARPLYARLNVFTQYPEKHRTLALRNGITEIGESDFEIIQKEMKKAAK